MSYSSGKKGLKRKECTFNWTRNTIVQLIELYESYPNLWDCSSENYKNRNLRKSAVDEISNKLGIPAQEVKDKIHNLRCQFQSINRKRKHTKSGQATGENFEVKWEFYDALKFIDGPTCSNETTMDSMVSLIMHFLYKFILPWNFSFLVEILCKFQLYMFCFQISAKVRINL